MAHIAAHTTTDCIDFFTDVLGIEQFHLGHDRGGSQDHSRIMYTALVYLKPWIIGSSII